MMMNDRIRFSTSFFEKIVAPTFESTPVWIESTTVDATKMMMAAHRPM